MLYGDTHPRGGAPHMTSLGLPTQQRHALIFTRVGAKLGAGSSVACHK
jgi:hypothetical protein